MSIDDAPFWKRFETYSTVTVLAIIITDFPDAETSPTTNYITEKTILTL